MSLEGKRALVTGATSGVGRATALRLASEGLSVMITGRDSVRLADVADRGAGSGRVVAFRADLESADEIEELVAEVRRRLVSLDVLVHSAGAIVLGSTEETEGDAFDLQYRTNLRAPHQLTRSLLPLLRERRGQVVFINSTAGLRAGARAGAYAATKHGLRAVADSLRDEVNADGIRVLSVFLGRTATPMQRRVHEFENRPYLPEALIQPEDIAEIVFRSLALPRTAEVTEIRLRPAVKPPQVESRTAASPRP